MEDKDSILETLIAQREADKQSQITVMKSKQQALIDEYERTLEAKRIDEKKKERNDKIDKLLEE